jgi:hypothetical protein
MQECHDLRLTPGPLSANGTDLALGQCVGFHLQVNFGVDIRSVQRDVSKPPSDGVEIDSSTQQVACGRMSNRMRTNAFAAHGRYPLFGLERVALDERVDSEASDRAATTIEKDQFVRRALAEQRGEFFDGQRP